MALMLLTILMIESLTAAALILLEHVQLLGEMVGLV
jgi:hypothetical protein